MNGKIKSIEKRLKQIEDESPSKEHKIIKVALFCMEPPNEMPPDEVYGNYTIRFIPYICQEEKTDKIERNGTK